MQQCLYNDTSSGIFFLMIIIWFYLKKITKNKGFASLTQMFMLLAWAPKIVESYIIVRQWVNTCFQDDSKRPTVKYYT